MNLSALRDAKAKTPTRTNGITDLMEIEISKIYPNPDQPRKYFDHVSLGELAESIKEKGLLQPISVVRRENRYMIIAGQRRWEAHKIIGALTIRAIVSSYENTVIDEMALIENIQRDDLTDLEVAMAIVRLWESGAYDQKQDLASVIAKPLSYISKAFSVVNKLDPTIIAEVKSERREYGMSVLDELARIKQPEKQREIYQRYKAGEITRDDFKEAAKPKAEKISRGKMKHVSTIFAKGGDSVESINFDKIISTLDPEKQYRITIEEI